MALAIIFGIMAFVCGAVVSAWIVRTEERALFLAELQTGEIEIEGYWFKVETVELPQPERVDHVSV